MTAHDEEAPPTHDGHGLTKRCIAGAVIAVGIAAVAVSLARPALLFPVPTDRIESAGAVQDETWAVTAPRIETPVPDYSIGIPKELAASAKPSGSSVPATGRSSTQPTVSAAVSRVLVREGDRVKAGQLLVELDTTMLDLGVEAARAAARKARADVGVIADALDSIEEGQGKLSDARGELTSARGKLLSTRAKLRTQRAKLVAQIAEVERTIAKLKAAPTPPPGAPVPPGADPRVLLRKLQAALAKMKAGLVKMDAGLAKLNAGLAKMGTGYAKLDSAEAQLADAKTQARNARTVLRVLQDAGDVGVDLALARRAQAFVVAPADGLVTYVRTGPVAMVGAPLVRLRPDGPVRVDTYLTAEQLGAVRVGAVAEVRSDSLPGKVLAGRVTDIGTDSVFPPSRFPTQIVHMTRAIRVTVTLDDDAWAPAGTPVDVSIRI